MENTIYENSKYLKNVETDEACGIVTFIDGQELSIPLDPDNRHYAEILKQVKEGKLTIQEAD